jgi:hypothetical protein
MFQSAHSGANNLGSSTGLKACFGFEVSGLLHTVNKYDTNQVARPAVHFCPVTLRIVTGVNCVPTHSFSSTFSPRGNVSGQKGGCFGKQRAASGRDGCFRAGRG